jgi:hypothetical protein
VVSLLPAAPLSDAAPSEHCENPKLTTFDSGIFGYINYLVEKDRKYILDTLINGKCSPLVRPKTAPPPRQLDS